MKISDIKEKSPFKDLFPVSPTVLDYIIKDIQKNGFDESEPLTVWENVCIDGHTRLKAARICDVETIPVISKDFKSIDEAIDFAVHKQRDRRNLTDGDILQYVKTMDTLRKRPGGQKGHNGKNQHSKKPLCASLDAPSKEKNRSSTPLAKVLGTNASKVERARTILDHADKHSRDMILKGGASINKIYKEVQKKRAVPKPPQSKLRPLAMMMQKAGEDLHVLIDGVTNGSIVPTHKYDRAYFESIRDTAPYFIELFIRLKINIPEIYKFITGKEIENERQRHGRLLETGETDSDNIVDIEPVETVEADRGGNG